MERVGRGEGAEEGSSRDGKGAKKGVGAEEEGVREEHGRIDY